jgi:hypothetical protein
MSNTPPHVTRYGGQSTAPGGQEQSPRFGTSAPAGTKPSRQEGGQEPARALGLTLTQVNRG